MGEEEKKKFNTAIFKNNLRDRTLLQMLQKSYREDLFGKSGIRIFWCHFCRERSNALINNRVLKQFCNIVRKTSSKALLPV